MVRKLFSAIGYEILRKERRIARIENFQNLVTVYQYQLNRNDQDSCQPGNELRVMALGRLLGTRPSQAFEMISALIKTNRISGDVYEFCVAKGETSALIANKF